MIRNLLKKRKAKRLVYKEYSAITPQSIATGFAFARAGVGGVRNHLESIKRHSRYAIRLFPEIELSRWALQGNNNAITREALNSVRLSDFGVVHSHVDPHFIRSCAAVNQSGTPWVHTYHTLYFPEDWGGVLQPWQQAINDSLLQEASNADIKISISPWLQALLRDKYGVETMVIPNGVDTDACRKARDVLHYIPRMIAEPYVLFSGSLSEVKNPRLYIDLARHFPDLTFAMIGKQLDQKSVTTYYGRPLPSNLKLIGPVDHATALCLTTSAEALVVTSHSEGLPTAVMEAMATGQRVVVPNSFGCKDLVTHNETGFLYEPGQLDDLKQQLAIALTNHSVGQYAIRLIDGEYAWPVVVAQLDALYAELISRG